MPLSKRSLVDRITGGLKAEFLAQIVYNVSNALLLLLLTRYLLTPGEYGMLYLALSVLGIAQLFSVLGLPKSTARYVAEYLETDPTQVPHILRVSLYYLFLAMGIVAVVLAIANEQIAGLIGEPALAPFLLVGVGYIAAASTLAFLRFVFQAFNQVTTSSTLLALSGVSQTVVGCGFVVLGFGALGALAGYTVGMAIVAILGFTVLYRRTRTFDTAERPMDGLGNRILRYAVPTTATRAGVVLDSRVDTILVGALLNPVAVGYYTLATQLVKFSIVPAESLGFSISPALAERKASDRIEHASQIYELSMRHVLLLYVPASVGIAIVAEPLVRHVFGAAYLGAVPVLYVYSVLIPVRAIHKITGDGLDYLGLAGVRARARVASALSNVVLNLLLIPVFGVAGAAIATVLSYTAYTAVTVYVISGELSFRRHRILTDLLLIVAISIGMGVVVLILLPFVSNVVSLFTVILVGVAVWLVLSVITGILDLRRVLSLLT